MIRSKVYCFLRHSVHVYRCYDDQGTRCSCWHKVSRLSPTSTTRWSSTASSRRRPTTASTCSTTRFTGASRSSTSSRRSTWWWTSSSRSVKSTRAECESRSPELRPTTPWRSWSRVRQTLYGLLCLYLTLVLPRLSIITLASSNGKRHITVWRPSVCPSVCLPHRHTHRDSPGGSMPRTFRPDNT